MTAEQLRLPLLLPTVAGLVEGIVSTSPWTVQCQRCCLTVSTDDLGFHGPNAASLLLLTSGLLFHHTNGDPRRLCRPCRIAEYPTCTCYTCDTDRSYRDTSDAGSGAISP